MVGEKGLEPSHVAILVPKTNASTNSATRPNYCCFIYYRTNLSNPNICVKVSKFKKNMIISPCISICKTDPVTGLCYGCARNNEEKRIWKDENTSDEWKIKNLEEIKSRLSGWQLDSFKQSYNYKIKEGISLFKKEQKK
jgi:predicted Fe-S protein YdhL (DUF1289 family)